MKTNSALKDFLKLAVLLVVGGIAASCTVETAPEGSDIDELRGQAEKLERKAQDIKADGRGEEAERLMREAKELHQQARRLEEERMSSRQKGEPNKPELKRELEHLYGRIDELKKQGKNEEIREVKQRILELEKQLGRRGPDRKEGDRKQPDRERAEREGGPGPKFMSEPRSERGGPEGRDFRPDQRQEVERRLHHLQVAIDNLHAAEMHDAADRLAREAEQMRKQLDAGPGRMGPSPEAEVNRLRGEIEDLRRAVKEMSGELERLRKERR